MDDLVNVKRGGGVYPLSSKRYSLGIGEQGSLEGVFSIPSSLHEKEMELTFIGVQQDERYAACSQFSASPSPPLLLSPPRVGAIEEKHVIGSGGEVSEEKHGLQNLPPELVEHILGFSSPTEWVALSQVCQRLQESLPLKSPVFWWQRWRDEVCGRRGLGGLLATPTSEDNDSSSKCVLGPSYVECGRSIPRVSSPFPMKDTEREGAPHEECVSSSTYPGDKACYAVAPRNRTTEEEHSVWIPVASTRFQKPITRQSRRVLLYTQLRSDKDTMMLGTKSTPPIAIPKLVMWCTTFSSQESLMPSSCSPCGSPSYHDSPLPYRTVQQFLEIFQVEQIKKKMTITKLFESFCPHPGNEENREVRRRKRKVKTAAIAGSTKISAWERTALALNTSSNNCHVMNKGNTSVPEVYCRMPDKRREKQLKEWLGYHYWYRYGEQRSGGGVIERNPSSSSNITREEEKQSKGALSLEKGKHQKNSVEEKKENSSKWDRSSTPSTIDQERKGEATMPAKWCQWIWYSPKRYYEAILFLQNWQQDFEKLHQTYQKSVRSQRREGSGRKAVLRDAVGLAEEHRSSSPCASLRSRTREECDAHVISAKMKSGGTMAKRSVTSSPSIHTSRTQRSHHNVSHETSASTSVIEELSRLRESFNQSLVRSVSFHSSHSPSGLEGAALASVSPLPSKKVVVPLPSSSSPSALPLPASSARVPSSCFLATVDPSSMDGIERESRRSASGGDAPRRNETKSSWSETLDDAIASIHASLLRISGPLATASLGEEGGRSVCDSVTSSPPSFASSCHRSRVPEEPLPPGSFTGSRVDSCDSVQATQSIHSMHEGHATRDTVLGTEPKEIVFLSSVVEEWKRAAAPPLQENRKGDGKEETITEKLPRSTTSVHDLLASFPVSRLDSSSSRETHLSREERHTRTPTTGKGEGRRRRRLSPGVESKHGEGASGSGTGYPVQRRLTPSAADKTKKTTPFCEECTTNRGEVHSEGMSSPSSRIDPPLASVVLSLAMRNVPIPSLVSSPSSSVLQQPTLSEAVVAGRRVLGQEKSTPSARGQRGGKEKEEEAAGSRASGDGRRSPMATTTRCASEPLQHGPRSRQWIPFPLPGRRPHSSTSEKRDAHDSEEDCARSGPLHSKALTDSDVGRDHGILPSSRSEAFSQKAPTDDTAVWSQRQPGSLRFTSSHEESSSAVSSSVVPGKESDGQSGNGSEREAVDTGWCVGQHGRSGVSCTGTASTSLPPPPRTSPPPAVEVPEEGMDTQQVPSFILVESVADSSKVGPSPRKDLSLIGNLFSSVTPPFSHHSPVQSVLSSTSSRRHSVNSSPTDVRPCPQVEEEHGMVHSGKVSPGQKRHGPSSLPSSFSPRALLHLLDCQDPDVRGSQNVESEASMGPASHRSCSGVRMASSPVEEEEEEVGWSIMHPHYEYINHKREQEASNASTAMMSMTNQTPRVGESSLEECIRASIQCFWEEGYISCFTPPPYFACPSSSSFFPPSCTTRTRNEKEIESKRAEGYENNEEKDGDHERDMESDSTAPFSFLPALAFQTSSLCSISLFEWTHLWNKQERLQVHHFIKEQAAAPSAVVETSTSCISSITANTPGREEREGSPLQDLPSFPYANEETPVDPHSALPCATSTLSPSSHPSRQPSWTIGVPSCAGIIFPVAIPPFLEYGYPQLFPCLSHPGITRETTLARHESWNAKRRNASPSTVGSRTTTRKNGVEEDILGGTETKAQENTLTHRDRIPFSGLPFIGGYEGKGKGDGVLYKATLVKDAVGWEGREEDGKRKKRQRKEKIMGEVDARRHLVNGAGVSSQAKLPAELGSPLQAPSTLLYAPSDIALYLTLLRYTSLYKLQELRGETETRYSVQSMICSPVTGVSTVVSFFYRYRHTGCPLMWMKMDVLSTYKAADEAEKADKDEETEKEDDGGVCYGRQKSRNSSSFDRKKRRRKPFTFCSSSCSTGSSISSFSRSDSDEEYDESSSELEENESFDIFQAGMGRVEVDIAPRVTLSSLRLLLRLLALPPSFPIPLLWNVVVYASMLGITIWKDYGGNFFSAYKHTFTDEVMKVIAEDTKKTAELDHRKEKKKQENGVE